MLLILCEEAERESKIEEGIKLRTDNFKGVKLFKYLNGNISAYGESLPDIKIRTATALKAMGELENI